MSEQKIYVPRSSCKQVSERLIKISFKAAEFRDFMNEHVNDRGYINLAISPRKEIGKYGDSHCLWLDTWKPGQKAEPRPPKPAEPAQDGLNIDPPGVTDPPF